MNISYILKILKTISKDSLTILYAFYYVTIQNGLKKRN